MKVHHRTLGVVEVVAMYDTYWSVKHPTLGVRSCSPEHDLILEASHLPEKAEAPATPAVNPNADPRYSEATPPVNTNNSLGKHQPVQATDQTTVINGKRVKLAEADVRAVYQNEPLDINKASYTEIQKRFPQLPRTVLRTIKRKQKELPDGKYKDFEQLKSENPDCFSDPNAWDLFQGKFKFA